MKQLKQFRLRIDGEIYPPFGIDFEFANNLQSEFAKQNKTVEILEI